MSVNARAQEVLETYASAAVNPEFTAAVTGAWGCGKTHFVKRFLQQRDERGLTNIYISLYGLSDTAAIDQSIFAALHPLLGGKAASFAAKLVKGLLKTTIQVDLDQDGKSDGSVSSTVPDVQLADWLKPKKGTLIVFDDLERTRIDVDDVLGYINSLVEHSEVRCVVLVNENEDAMREDQREKYRVRKEKTIGLTVKVLPDFDEAYATFGQALFPNSAVEFEQEWKQTTRAAFEQSGKNNLRLLRQALLYFSWAYDKFPADAKRSNEVTRSYLSVHLPTAFEFLSGTLKQEQLDPFLDTSGVARYLASEKEEKDPVRELADRYTIFDEKFRSKSAVVFFTFLLRDGAIVEDKLVELLNTHPALITASTPPWRRLWFWRDLQESEIQSLATVVRAQITNGEFSNVYQLLLAVSTLISLATRGMISGISASHSLGLGKDAVRALALKGDIREYERVRDLRIDTSSGYDGLGYSSDLPEFVELARYANDLRATQYDSFLERKSVALLQSLSTDAQSFAETISNLNGIFSHRPLFSRFTVEDFLERLRLQKTVAGYWDVSTGIEHRFIASNTEVYKDLLPELSFFEELDAAITREEQAGEYGPVARRGLLDLKERGLAHAIDQLRSCKERVEHATAAKT